MHATAFDLEAVVREELRTWNNFIDNIMRIPDAVFKEHGASGLDVEIYKEACEAFGEDDHRHLLKSAEASFEALCESVPHVPRDAVKAASMGYVVMTMASDPRYAAEGATGAVRSLMTAAMARGMAMQKMIGSPRTDEADKDAILAMARSELARTAANARHTENRAMKADAFTWLDANMPNLSSLDAAATALTRQQPVAFRTARSWVDDWKKLRSAGTP